MDSGHSAVFRLNPQTSLYLKFLSALDAVFESAEFFVSVRFFSVPVVVLYPISSLNRKRFSFCRIRGIFNFLPMDKRQGIRISHNTICNTSGTQRSCQNQCRNFNSCKFGCRTTCSFSSPSLCSSPGCFSVIAGCVGSIPSFSLIS